MADAFVMAWNLMKGSAVPQYARTKDRDFGVIGNASSSGVMDTLPEYPGEEQETRRGSFMNHPRPTNANEKEVFMTHSSLSNRPHMQDKMHERVLQTIGRNPTATRDQIEEEMEPQIDTMKDEIKQHREDNRRGMLTAEKMPAPSPWGR